MKRALTAVGVVTALAVIVSCTGAAPEILQDHAEVYLYRNRDLEVSYERMAFFLSARDEDGFEDIETLYLIHDEARRYWVVDADRWQSKEREEETWIGRNDIQMADYTSLPRGRYRVLLMDAAGERDEQEIRVATPAVPTSAVQFPDLRLDEDRFIIDSRHQSHTIHAFDAAGNLVVSREVGSRVVPLSDVVGANPDALRGFTLYLYAFDQENQVPLLIGPYEF
jgi:hypothetical protein